ncbi:MAG: hypothetical protein J7K15_12940 [Deltaproteobacteria bacterium]|nr:hypothetical protein [Deltaproteobacteria bacterium]
MTDLKKLLAEKQATYKALTEQLEKLEAQRRLLIEEILRLEGEIRILRQLIEEGDKDGG